MGKRRVMKFKKGQFYLLAAIVIITIIIAFSAISNYSNKKTSTRIYDLGQELGIEGESVVDYGVISGEDKLEDFISKVSQYVSDLDIVVFIFGDTESITVRTYQEITSGSVSIGNSQLTITQDGYFETNYTPLPGENTVDVLIGEIEYEFELNPGENFYFVISQNSSTGNEVFVSQY